MNSEASEKLDEALARLPRELSPARDLWPAIAQAMNEGAARQGREPGLAHGLRRPRWPVALAASLALLCLVAALSWSVLRLQARTAMLAQGGTAAGAQQSMVSFDSPRDAAFLAARAALESTYAQRLALLAPATRARVQTDLEIIRKANADIRDALKHDPASPLLQQLLRSTWQQEIELYTDVSQATEPMLTRRT
ncbi:MAG TPA: hypothetical protein VF931_07405 [Steroidobacteraceae bacterium]